MSRDRNIATCIILTIVTCGIYGIYWFIVLTDEIGREAGDSSISGGVAFLLTLVTCNIYGIYWAYKMGQLLDDAKRRRGIQVGSDMAVVYLILQIFGFGIVNNALMQSELNKMNSQI